MHTPPRRGAIIRHAQSWRANKTLPPILPRLRVASRSCLHSGTGLGPLRARRHGELPIYRLFYTILHALTRRRAASTFPFLRTQPRQRMQLSLPSSPMSSEQLRAYLRLTALLKLFTRSQIGDLFEANRRRLARIDVVVCRAYLLQFRYALRFVVRSQKTTHRIISTALLAFAAQLFRRFRAEISMRIVTCRRKCNEYAQYENFFHSNYLVNFCARHRLFRLLSAHCGILP